MAPLCAQPRSLTTAFALRVGHNTNEGPGACSDLVSSIKVMGTITTLQRRDMAALEKLTCEHRCLPHTDTLYTAAPQRPRNYRLRADMRSLATAPPLRAA